MKYNNIYSKEIKIEEKKKKYEIKNQPLLSVISIFVKFSNSSTKTIIIFKVIIFLNIIINIQTIESKRKIKSYYSYITLME